MNVRLRRGESVSDWRLQGQQRFLLNASLAKRRYCPRSRDWDHDHCAFCWAKFSESPEDLQTGYCTLDKYHWVCPQCYEDFKEQFGWVLVED